MSKIEVYRHELRRRSSGWDDYLLAESGLPGPRANLELMQAVAAEADLRDFERWLALDSDEAPVNSPAVFLACCGVVGLGRLAAEGNRMLIVRLHTLADDPRWRVREAVAMALQRIGEVDMDWLVEICATWSKGSWLQQRAAIAALAEPRLLVNPTYAGRILAIFDRVTAGIEAAGDRKEDNLLILRQGLGYAWSVVVSAYPAAGKPTFKRWLESPSGHVRWLLKENLTKNRLLRMDPDWVERCRASLQKGKSR